MHTKLFANNRKLHKYATYNLNFKTKLLSDMHHRITYLYINFQQNRVSRSVKTVHTSLFANIYREKKLFPQTDRQTERQTDGRTDRRRARQQ